MKGYIALLRGINVSGQKKIKMADLKAMFEKIGFTSVVTYIQSGNIIFKSDVTSVKEISNMIKSGIFDHFAYDVPVLVLTLEVLENIYNDNPYADLLQQQILEGKKMYFTLLSSLPDMAQIDDINKYCGEDEDFTITDEVVYFYAANGYGKTKLSNNFFEKKLKCTATTRNLKTVIKLLELSKENSKS